MNKRSILWWMLIMLVGLRVNSFAQGSSKDAEIETLKQRVRELEEQNRAILKTLEEIKNQLGPRPVAVSYVNESKPPSAAQPSSSTSQAAQSGVTANKKEDPVRWGELLGGDSRIRFYGFLRMDMDIDDSRANNGQTPLFILSEDPRVGRKDAGNFTMHPRLTRFGVNYSSPTIGSLGDSRLGGQLELDFQNGGSESRQIIRIRHAYLKLTHGDLSLLGGQTWDVISPLFPAVNNDTLMWNTGNLGDRRPQLIASYEPKVNSGQFTFTGGIGLTGAIDPLDLDNNGFRDGEESARPMVQARVGYSHASWVKDQRASLGVWGHRGWMRTSRAVAGRTEFRSQSTGLDYSVPVHERVAVRGEAWFGRNLSDVRGGVAQAINPATGAAIRSRGGWIEANLKAHPRLTINPGFTSDDPRDRDIPVQGRTRNRAWYVANRISLGGGLIIGADYLRWVTDYKGLLRGADNRVNLFLQYSF